MEVLVSRIFSSSSQGSSPDSGTSVSSRDATPAGRDPHKEEDNLDEEEESEEEEEEEEEEETGESEEGEADEEEAKVVLPVSKKKPMFLLRRLVSAKLFFITKSNILD